MPEQGRTRLDANGAAVHVAVSADSERFRTDLLSTLNGGASQPDIRAASNEEAEYFIDLGVAVADLSTAVETLFVSPSAQTLEEIEQRADNGELTTDDEITLRTFFTDFWTGADEHMRVLRITLAQLDAPASVASEHADYLAALDAVIDAKHDRLADIATRNAKELLGILWEPDDSIEALNTACTALDAAGSRVGIDAETCPE